MAGSSSEALKDSVPEPEQIPFKCSSCSLAEICDYYGQEPPFAKQYRLLECSYVMRDPFSEPKSGNFIAVGSDCKRCGLAVCKDAHCSVYYDGSTYCLACAKEIRETLPRVVQEKIDKASQSGGI